jgi:hypothetical protein
MADRARLSGQCVANHKPPKPPKQMKIKHLIKRESPGAFIVEDDQGNQFFVQLAHKLEAIYQGLSDKQKALLK